MSEEFPIFLKDCNGDNFMLYIKNSMTVMQLKEKLFEEYGKNPANLILIYSSKPLKDDNDLRDISAYSTIYLTYCLLGGYSGFGVDMADISNEEGLVKKNFSKNALKWNFIDDGLNLTGKCENSDCEAYNKTVDCKIGLGTFDLVGNYDQAKCPMCKKEINVTTCTFCKCEYKIEGKKKTNEGTVQVNTSWKIVEKDYEYYDPLKSGTVTWLKLIIQTKSLPNSQSKKNCLIF